MAEGFDDFLKGMTPSAKEKEKGLLPDVFSGTDLRIDSTVTKGVPTRIPKLDLSIGRPGLPLGRVVEMYGFEHCGKTTAALGVVAQAQRMGGYCLWIDSEHCFDPSWARKCGCDPDNIMVAGADTLEQIFRLIDKALEQVKTMADETPLVIVTDSVTAVESELNAKKDFGESERVGADAKAIKRALRRINSKIAKLPVMPIFITHAFKTISVNQFADDESGGGHGLKFYASVRLRFQRTGNLTEGAGAERTYKGQEIKIRLKKNKIMTTGKMDVVADLNERGFDLHDGLLEGLMALGEVEKPTVQTYRIVRSDTTIKKSEWPAFVEEQGGGADKMYKFFLQCAVEQGLIVPYGV
jgi:recombination protein RecA